MKVVLFCGGLGMRQKEDEESLPKPLVRIGNMPILWHVMKYYAHFGHKEFILCLGYKAELIKQHFLNHNELIVNDFVLSNGGRDVKLLDADDTKDWKITFVNTGLYSNFGQRLKAIRRHVAGDEMFLANYSDGLTDLPLREMIRFAQKQNTIASFLCVKPNLSYHFVSTNGNGAVTDICDIQGSHIRINGGYYVFKQGIFDYLKEGEELLLAPFQRLAKNNQLSAYLYDGFWASLDTFKDKQQLQDMHMHDRAPWEVWKNIPSAPINV